MPSFNTEITFINWKPSDSPSPDHQGLGHTQIPVTQQAQLCHCSLLVPMTKGAQFSPVVLMGKLRHDMVKALSYVLQFIRGGVQI